MFNSNSKVRDKHILPEEAKKRSEYKLPGEKAIPGDLVDIDIVLTSANPTEHDVSTAINAVFLAPEESIREIVPDFWRGYFDQVEGRTPEQDNFGEKVYRAKPGEVSAPRAVHQVDPEFSEPARNAKYEGKVGMSMVVDRTGSVQNIQLTSPLGMGLDEKGVEAVHQWKFQPSMKAGEPVAARITVDVEFRLY